MSHITLVWDRAETTNKLEKVFIESQVTIMSAQKGGYRLGKGFFPTRCLPFILKHIDFGQAKEI